MTNRAARSILALTFGCAIATAATASPQSLGPDLLRPVVMHDQAGAAAQAPAVSSERALVNRYCVTCHNERRKTPEGAPLMLDKLDIDRVADDPAIWEKVVRKVKSGAMPPAGMPRPQPAAFAAWVTSIEGALDRAAAAAPNPGRPAPVHRLNRAEYTNAVRDLLGLDVDGRALLPADDAGYGFDNIGDVLSVSPGLLERYMLAATKISRQAIGDGTLRPTTETYRTSPLMLQDDRMSEDLPFGSRGGLAVRHHFPLDGEYVLKIDLSRNLDGARIRGVHQMDVRVDRMRVASMEIDAARAGMGSGKAGVDVPFTVKAGTHLVSVSFVGSADQMLPRDGQPSPPPPSAFAFQLYPIDAAVNNIQILGPYNGQVPEDTVSRRRVFVCRPASQAEEKPCARQILSALARRAYRRPVTDADVAPLLATYEAGRASGDFEAGIRLGLEAILVSPKFLFRIEQDPAKAVPGKPYRVNDLELASRLSFFLWSSIPDDALLDLAARGKLRDPGVVDQQVRRMLADERSRALVANFAGQWLYLRNLRLAAPNASVFPEFDDNLREAFQRETELFIEEQLRSDPSVEELLTANYTFVNERLAEHYGLPNVYGSHFRKVTFSDDRRAGLLGQGSILTVTSEPNRTSPVKRGKWLLENLLGAPPPPPPPNVPALKENDEGGKPTTVRERMEQHRKNPVCASCHAQMDPIGFALDNFDAIGRWRTVDHEAQAPIDASGTLIDGSSFNGPSEFRALLLKRRVDFANTVVEKLLTYGLGRGLEPYDMPVVRQIMRDVAPSEYRWSGIISAIVKSPPFQTRLAGPSAVSDDPNPQRSVGVEKTPTRRSQ
jgi:hypothetical protein